MKVILRGISFILCVGHIWQAYAQTGCLKTRAAFDIGSGATKLVVAQVNTCTQQVVEVIAPKPGKKLDRKVRYKQNIIPFRGEKIFSAQVIATGIKAIKELMAIAKKHGAQEYSAVATSAFRRISKSYQPKIVARIAKETGLKVSIISQLDEARIGFESAIVKTGIERDKIMVWDIGGGSMQISYIDNKTKKYKTYQGRFASEAMVKYIVSDLQGKNYRLTSSPNPMATKAHTFSKPHPHLVKAIEHSQSVAKQTIPKHFLKVQNKRLVGIGGVHFYGICEVLKAFSGGGCSYNRVQLERTIHSLVHLSDQQLLESGHSLSLEYAPFRISSGALVSGFLRALNQTQVRAIKADMSDGILSLNEYWL